MTINTRTSKMENQDITAWNDSDSESVVDSDECKKDNLKWVDSISKILKTNKSKRKKTLILSKSKKISSTTTKSNSKAEFEVEVAKDQIKSELIVEQKEHKETESDSNVHKRKKKKEIPILRRKPNILHKDRERLLCKIATKGVVQLFNAIKTQQNDTKGKLEEAGPMEIKQRRVLRNVDKKAFLDMLMQEKSENIQETESVVNKVVNRDKIWNVLRDDFMVGAKLKDWDKELENENSEKEEEVDMETE